MKTVAEREGKRKTSQKTRKMALDDKVAKYGLYPMAIGFFGGVLDFNKMNPLPAEPLVLSGHS